MTPKHFFPLFTFGAGEDQVLRDAVNWIPMKRNGRGGGLAQQWLLTCRSAWSIGRTGQTVMKPFWLQKRHSLFDIPRWRPARLEWSMVRTLCLMGPWPIKLFCHNVSEDPNARHRLWCRGFYCGKVRSWIISERTDQRCCSDKFKYTMKSTTWYNSLDFT